MSEQNERTRTKVNMFADASPNEHEHTPIGVFVCSCVRSDEEEKSMSGFYSTPAWRRLRDWKLSANPMCELCRRLGRLTPACEVDHILPINSGGAPLDQDNLQSLCKTCHSRKTMAERHSTTMKGCDANGRPVDPNHPWSKEKSLRADARDRMLHLRTELVSHDLEKK